MKKESEAFIEKTRIYYDIDCLRSEIRLDMKDYRRLRSSNGFSCIFSNGMIEEKSFDFFKHYLLNRINTNLNKLQKIVPMLVIYETKEDLTELEG